MSKIAARCPHCKRERSHRECFPEQYAHSLVGHHVTVRTRTGFTTSGTVERVTSTRFGLLAHLTTSGDTAYLVSDCVRTDPKTPRRNP